MTNSHATPGALMSPPLPPQSQARRAYLTVLTWAFTALNSVRILSYLPTLWAIWASGDSNQHSLFTWGIWFGANVTMAAWLREHNGGTMNRAAAINAVNSVMCLATLITIAWQRL